MMMVTMSGHLLVFGRDQAHGMGQLYMLSFAKIIKLSRCHLIGHLTSAKRRVPPDQ